jgi:predicted TIM-barrel fold metal-dependent hydrolase
VTIVDSDEHLSEPPTMWADHIDPAYRDQAIRMETDDLGYMWLNWAGQHLGLVDVQTPGDTAQLGDHRQRLQRGERARYDYAESLPASHWDPAARVAWLDEIGIDEAICFPNFGLGWERRVGESLPALTANMRAWNRWCASIVVDGGGRLHPVAHMTLRDAQWAMDEIGRVAAAGIRLAMIAPGPVDGKALSHPDHEPIWSAFEDHGITPVFHVADQPRVFDDGWYGSDDTFVQPTEAVFLWVPAALGLTDLILHGVFERHPRLVMGVVELSAVWVPQWLMMLDGGADFTTKLNGRPTAPLARRPSDYFKSNVRVSSFSYERPDKLIRASGDLFMCCSDFPHSEGTKTMISDYRAVGCEPSDRPGLFRDNAALLLRE